MWRDIGGDGDIDGGAAKSGGGGAPAAGGAYVPPSLRGGAEGAGAGGGGVSMDMFSKDGAEVLFSILIVLLHFLTQTPDGCS
jgi:hypothetical protein